MLTSQPATCAAVAGTPRFGPAGCFFAGCAAAMPLTPQSKTTNAALRIHVAHGARGRNAPALDRVVVIAERRAALREQRGACGLHGAVLVHGAALEHARAPVPAPRHAKA